MSPNKCKQQEKKKEMDWAHPGKRLTTKDGCQKKMAGKWTRARRKHMMLCWLLTGCI